MRGTTYNTLIGSVGVRSVVNKEQKKEISLWKMYYHSAQP